MIWADLQATQPTLPNDPSDTTVSPTMDHPVQRVTWYEAVLFANLMSLRDGFARCYYKDAGFTTPVDASNYTSGSFYFNFKETGYRLPTEAEWEYAARAGTTGPFSTHEPNYTFGNCATCYPDPPLPVLDSIAWWCGNTGSSWPEKTAQPVGTKLANPWGLYDMHGNMSEWCWDWAGSYPSGSVTDPTGPSTGMFRILRGGSWACTAARSRSADRYSRNPGSRSYARGFRLLRTTRYPQP
jgi:formylglycine-generating enzyme required for sulfatase activity